MFKFNMDINGRFDKITHILYFLLIAFKRNLKMELLFARCNSFDNPRLTRSVVLSSENGHCFE